MAIRKKYSIHMSRQRVDEKHGITMMQATPATWRGWLDAEWKPSLDLRFLVGEALPGDCVLLREPRRSGVEHDWPTETEILVFSCSKVW